MQDSASDSEARDMYSSVLDIAADVGFIVPLTSFTRCHVRQLKAAFIESQISSCKDELNQFIEGLCFNKIMVDNTLDYLKPYNFLLSVGLFFLPQCD